MTSTWANPPYGPRHRICLHPIRVGLIDELTWNPDDNAKVESFIKTLKDKVVYLMTYETYSDVCEYLSRVIDGYYTRRLHSGLGYVSQVQFEHQQTCPPAKIAV